MISKDFKWARPTKGFEGFAIDEEIPVINGGFLVIPENFYSSGQEPYHPLRDHSGLFRQFAATDPTPEGILRFANRFGPLGIDADPDKTALHGGHEREHLSEWYWHLHVIKSLILLWDSIQSGDTIFLKDRLVDRKSMFQAFDEETIDILSTVLEVENGAQSPFDPVPTGRPGIEFLKGDVFTQGRIALIEKINDYLANETAPEMVMSASTWKPRIQLTPLSLAGAIWLQFAFAVHGEKEYRNCGVCNEPFEISLDAARSNRVFCSDRCRFKAYRLRIKKAQEMATEGISAEEIAATLDSTEATVRGWINKEETSNA